MHIDASPALSCPVATARDADRPATSPRIPRPPTGGGLASLPALGRGEAPADDDPGAAMTTQRPHRVLAVFTSTLLAATFAAPPAFAAGPTAEGQAPTQVSAPVPVLDWRPCGAGLEPFLCASAEVPR